MANKTESQLDACFGALAHPTRRAMVEILGEGPKSVGELADQFSVALPTISKHLSVLERAGLLLRIKEGRTRRCHLVPEPLADADAWIRHYRRFWRGQLRSLERYLRENPEDP